MKIKTSNDHNVVSTTGLFIFQIHKKFIHVANIISNIVGGTEISIRQRERFRESV